MENGDSSADGIVLFNKENVEMKEFVWTKEEKRSARLLFDKVVKENLTEILIQFKEMASQAESPEKMWQIEEFLGRKRREIDGKYNFRESRIVSLFGHLLEEKRISLEDIQELSEDKIDQIKMIASFP